MRILKDYNERSFLQEELERKDKETAERIKAISTIAVNISQGNYDIRVDDTKSDALGSVGESLNSMGVSLKTSFDLLSQKEWLQSGIAKLNNVMIGDKELERLSKDVIEFLCQYTKSSAGVIYAVDGEELYAISGYSYLPNKNREHIKQGEGLIGQCVVSRKILELKSFSEKDVQITYALGEIKPKHIVAVPLIDTKIEGAFELASVKEFTEVDLEFLQTVSNSAGTSGRNPGAIRRIKDSA